MSELTYRLFIDGKWVDSEGGGEVLEVLNPATEEVIGTVPQASGKDVVAAIEAARRAFDEGPWPRMSPKERSAVMLKMADVMERRMPEIVALNQREAGSVGWLAESIQVGIPLQHWRDMAERVLPQYQFEEPVLPYVGVGIGQGVIVKEPIGVVSLISAYNFPFFLSIMKLAPALAAGCTCVLKPAPTTPLEVFIIGEFAQEAGLPPGVLNIVTGDVEAGQELTSNPLVDMVSFTGSDTVGRLVMAQAAPTMKKVVLELGGKSASIICDDADLTKAIQDPIMGMTVHSGQGCSLLTRTLVHESRFDELVEMIKGALSQITLGDPTDPATGMGPLISAAQRAKVESLIQTGVDEGATIAFGGGRPAGLDKGFYVEPTLFVDVDNTMTIAQKEFFGPVGVVIPFRDDEDAIRIANDSEFGLGGAVWAKDPARAYAIAKRIRTGMVTVNGGGGLSPHYAFGGYKQSGVGREWGAAGLGEFLETKTIAWSVASG
ncbi:MAG: putative aldehyde dehydrogenase [Marmoricola sp.]|nr:putative aldehyde dehydrogenase [Marmoricola sp.]